jgi:predicted transcriptional regulator
MTKETLTINIDKDLKIELKVMALRKETTVTQLLTEMIEDYVNENK